MTITGGCFCGAVRFAVEGEPIQRGQCHCTDCQKFTGGAENYYMVMPAAGFSYVKGEPKRYARPVEGALVREFCATCGTHLAARSPRSDAIVIVKVGGLDDPAVFEGPQAVIWTAEAQPFHMLPEGVPTFEGFPKR